ncbi:tryptophan halogenase family protein [Duganella sp. FT27W]|uniref:tryptophan halogenase family protein n=1 Tax=Duganella sp. FT27W TaxID=2654636 RepID=UPI00128B7DC8|nr:tryptophan halogenase family protein [Duganella sp. FT27W]MPQ55487.1 FAD-dependent oxidoreductase [Duganella sp. FT27W]
MSQHPIRTIVIVGGGTAGWMTAAALSKTLGDSIAIRLVESDDIGTVGVGESTIPMIRRFNQALGIDEADFVRATRATYKLGIEFCDWGHEGERYMHGFGRFGQDLGALDFHHYWLRQHHAGKEHDLGRYSINQMAARTNRFMPADPALANSPLGDITHAYHVDAGLYARYLRTYAEARGVRRTEGKVVDTVLRTADGHVDAVRLQHGELLHGDLFIDCSGFRALLIGAAMGSGWEDWRHWLPCDSAWAVPCASAGEPLPYTRATARPAGWQWRIGLQHRTGNGHVFSSAHMDDDAARTILLANLDGAPLAEPKLLRFGAGRRTAPWQRNVVAIGLSSGFLEPLESTSIHMIQTAIARLLAFFPDRAFAQADSDEYNRQSAFESERIRDFLILHYHATRRTGTAFWDHCRTMALPDSLQARLELWRSRGRIVREGGELFSEVGWLQVLVGQGIAASGYHALADVPGEQQVANHLAGVAAVMRKCVDVMPAHGAYINHLLRSNNRESHATASQ